MAKGARVMYWHRTDLRLHDSPGLHAALDLKPEAFWPVWTWNPHYVHRQAVGPNRWRFLLDSMTDVSESYTKINPKQQLWVIRGPPETLLPVLFKQWGITHLVFEADPDPYAKKRDEEATKLAEEAGVKVIVKHGFTLHNVEETIKLNKGNAPLNYNHFCKLMDEMGDPAKPLDAPTSLPDPGDTSIGDLKREDHPIDEYRADDVNHESRKGDDHSYETFAGPDGKFSEELNMEPATSSIRGGETRGLAQMEEWLKDKKRVIKFEKPKTDPAVIDLDNPSTTVLSAFLKFGALSCRTFYWKIREIIDGSSHSAPPMSLIGQLYFREQFNTLMSMNENWRQMLNNPMCRYIDWRLANEYDEDGQLKQREDDPEAEAQLEAWKTGQTGFPWIDAIMRQLAQEGWIHHLARHSVACFLTRGQLYISWERGEEVFARYLVDWNSAMNVANWMWLSASQFFTAYYRVYSPVAFPKKYKESPDYIRKYVPELAKFPDKHIYEPHKAPKHVQEKAGCIIGEQYPQPIVDANEAKGDCIARIKAAYALKINGDAPEALNGSAKKQLRAQFEKEHGGSGGKRKREDDDEDGGDDDEDQKPEKVAGGSTKSATKSSKSSQSHDTKRTRQTKLK